jgi:hypothetical protein
VTSVHADINSDPEMGWYATGLSANLTAVIVAQHERKPNCNCGTGKRCSTRHFCSFRWCCISFALLPAQKVNKESNAVYLGAVVKSNGATSRDIRT